ncbi:MAG TPA: protein kinase, partial [Bryobacteraceae bacterium]|nr:protein kinase [Bryobacteraceae bacterium]
TKLEYMAHVCDALATAHRSGIAHGNIKPSNLFLVAGEDLRILDFGTGRWVASILGAGGRLPNLDAHHLAPEQILGDFFDARSDVFSVALILYQLLTDKYPFPVPDAVVPREIVHTEPAPLRQLDPQIPEALEQLVASALHKDPQQRLQTAGAFAAALRAIAAPPRPASIPMPVQQLAPPAPPPASTPQPAKPRAKKPGSTRKRVLTYIVAGVLALGITGTLLLRKGVDASPAPAAAAPSVPAKPEAEQAVQSKPAETPTRPVAPTPIVSPPSPEEQAQLSSVKSLWESGQYEQAMTLVNQVLAKNANSSGAKSWRRKIRAAQDAEAAIK